MESVGDLLKASLAAHLRAKPSRPKELRDMSKADIEWREALRLRLEAAAADPERIDPAWQEKPSHEDMLAFYAEKGITNGK